MKTFIKNADNVVRFLELKKNKQKDGDTCDVCFERLQKEDKINPFMHAIWKDNAKYRVFTDLHHSYTEHIFRHEPIKGRSGKIPNEKLDNYLNSLLNY